MVVNEHGRDEEITAFSNSRDPADQMTEESVNSTIFTFMRTSAQFVSPQISTLSIDSVSSGLNGTVVNCMDILYNPVISASTIQVIGISHSEFTAGIIMLIMICIQCCNRSVLSKTKCYFRRI